MNPDCVFCKIAAGALPSVRVYEDEAVLAFLDIAPLVPGHTLVIPRAHYDPLTAVPAPLLARLMAVVQAVAAAQTAGLGAAGVNVHQANGAAAGQVVPHVHFHVVPRFAGDGHHWNWNAGPTPPPERLRALADGMRAALRPPVNAGPDRGVQI